MEFTHDADVAAAVEAYLNSNPDLKLSCPMCGCSQWKYGFICELPEQLTKKPFLVIPFVCDRCPYTALLAAARIMGAVP